MPVEQVFGPQEANCNSKKGRRSSFCYLLSQLDIDISVSFSVRPTMQNNFHEFWRSLSATEAMPSLKMFIRVSEISKIPKMRLQVFAGHF